MRRAIEELETGDDDDVECIGPGHKATLPDCRASWFRHKCSSDLMRHRSISANSVSGRSTTTLH